MLQNGEYKVQVGGVEHWYRVAGAERGTVPLVIVHGGPGGNCYNFERTAGPGLEALTTVIYYEQRGSGRSAAPADPGDYSLATLVADLDALRDAWGLERMWLLGFSFGGELALAYAVAHPERVDKLVAQCPSLMKALPERGATVQLYGFYAVAEEERRQQLAALLGDPRPIGERLNEAWGLADSALVDRFLFHNPEAARLNRQMWRECGLTNTGEMHRALAAKPADPQFVERLNAITAPTLVAVGLYDRNLGVEQCRDIAAAIPGARLEIFAHSAHFPEAEETERYVQVVGDFLSA